MNDRPRVIKYIFEVGDGAVVVNHTIVRNLSNSLVVCDRSVIYNMT